MGITSSQVRVIDRPIEHQIQMRILNRLFELSGEFRMVLHVVVELAFENSGRFGVILTGDLEDVAHGRALAQTTPTAKAMRVRATPAMQASMTIRGSGDGRRREGQWMMV